MSKTKGRRSKSASRSGTGARSSGPAAPVASPVAAQEASRTGSSGTGYPAAPPAPRPPSTAVRHAVQLPGAESGAARSRPGVAGGPGRAQRRLRHRPDAAGRRRSPADPHRAAAGPPGAGRARRVVPRRPRLGAVAAQGDDHPDGAGRAARRPGRAGPAVPPGRSAVAGGGAALRTAGVRPPERRRSDRRPAPRRQGDGTAQRPDHRALPRGDADPGRSRAGCGPGRVAGTVPRRRGRHRDRAFPPAGPPSRSAGHRAVGSAVPGQAGGRHLRPVPHPAAGGGCPGPDQLPTWRSPPALQGPPTA